VQRDPLTGLADRDALAAEVSVALHRHGRVAVLFIDVDGLKAVNDSCGHVVGDGVLSEIGNRLRHSPEVLAAARLGGDEFGLLVDVETGVEETGARAVAEVLHARLRQPYRVGTRTVAVSVSIGLADGRQRDPLALLHHADLAMYEAKRRGGDTVVVVDAALAHASRRDAALAERVERAVAQGCLGLARQRVQDLRDGRCTGVEVFLRFPGAWAASARTDQLLAQARLAGVEGDATRWVLANARTSSRGDATTVNVEARLLAELSGEIAAAELGIELVGLQRCRDLDPVLGSARDLAAAGVPVWLDDVGGPGPWLDVWRGVPLTGVKLTSTLVQDLDNPATAAAVSGLCGIAAAQGQPCVAVGVESTRQAARLAEIGCARGQGYAVRPPEPLTQLPRDSSGGLDPPPRDTGGGLDPPPRDTSVGLDPLPSRRGCYSDASSPGTQLARQTS
jgi:diguanylate cyclase (GGDEF)-like protein